MKPMQWENISTTARAFPNAHRESATSMPIYIRICSSPSWAISILLSRPTSAGRFFVCKEQMTDDEAGLLTKKRTRRQLHLVTIIRVHVIDYLLVNIDFTIYLPYTHRRSNVDCRDLTKLNQ